MSTILKALQRLEDEKSSGKDRSLNEQVVARRSGAVAKSRWAVIGVALLSGIAVGSTALFFWPDGGAPAATEADQPVVASTTTQSASAKRVPESPAKPLGTADAAETMLRKRAANRAAAPVLPMVEVVERLEAHGYSIETWTEKHRFEPYPQAALTDYILARRR